MFSFRKQALFLGRYVNSSHIFMKIPALAGVVTYTIVTIVIFTSFLCLRSYIFLIPDRRACSCLKNSQGHFFFSRLHTCWPQIRIHLFIFGLILLYFKNKIAIYTHLTWGTTSSSHTEKNGPNPPKPIPQNHS